MLIREMTLKQALAWRKEAKSSSDFNLKLLFSTRSLVLKVWSLYQQYQLCQGDC